MAQNTKCTRACRQVHVLQILYNKAVCIFVILWKNTKFQMLVHKDENNVLALRYTDSKACTMP